MQVFFPGRPTLGKKSGTYQKMLLLLESNSILIYHALGGQRLQRVPILLPFLKIPSVPQGQFKGSVRALDLSVKSCSWYSVIP